MKIISLNINDFGGKNYRMQECKKTNNRNEKVLDWTRWNEIVTKEGTKGKFLKYIDENKPDILVLQEFPINVKMTINIEKMDYHDNIFNQILTEMWKRKYKLVGNLPGYGVSMTVIFINCDYAHIDTSIINSGKLQEIVDDECRCGRFCTIQVGDYIIHGTHVPSAITTSYPKYVDTEAAAKVKGLDGKDYYYDVRYYTNMIQLYQMYRENKVLFVGDFNTYDEGTPYKEKINELIEKGGMIDVWIGDDPNNPNNPNDTETCNKRRIDYALVSPNMYEDVKKIDIDRTTLNNGISDHAALIIELN